MEIPRNILCTIRSRTFLHPLAASCLQRLAALHRQWKVRIVDERAIAETLLDKFPNLRILLESGVHPRVVYSLYIGLEIWEHGGFYLDADIYLAVKLDSLVNHQCVLLSTESGEVSSSLIGITPKHPIASAYLNEHIDSLERQPLTALDDERADHAFGSGALRRVVNHYRDDKSSKILSESKSGFGPRLISGLSDPKTGEPTVHYRLSSWRTQRRPIG